MTQGDFVKIDSVHDIDKEYKDAEKLNGGCCLHNPANTGLSRALCCYA